MKKLWSFVAIVSVLGLIILALPQLPGISFTKLDGIFSVAWLLLAGCIVAGQSQELRRRRKKSVAKLELRQPKPLRQKRRADSQ